MSISNYAEDKILDAVFNNISFAVTTPYVSLHESDPGETGASELSVTRQSASFGSASGGALSNDALIEFTSMPACTVNYVSIWDASSSGNCLWTGAVSPAKTVNSGDTFQFAIGDLDVTLD